MNRPAYNTKAGKALALVQQGFVIEHDIPIPPVGLRDGSVASTFRKMSVGDSVVMPNTRRSCIASVSKLCNIKVTARRIDKNSFRVWRVA